MAELSTATGCCCSVCSEGDWVYTLLSESRTNRFIEFTTIHWGLYVDDSKMFLLFMYLASGRLWLLLWHLQWFLCVFRNFWNGFNYLVFFWSSTFTFWIKDCDLSLFIVGCFEWIIDIVKYELDLCTIRFFTYSSVFLVELKCIFWTLTRDDTRVQQLLSDVPKNLFSLNYFSWDFNDEIYDEAHFSGPFRLRPWEQPL